MELPQGDLCSAPECLERCCRDPLVLPGAEFLEGPRALPQEDWVSLGALPWRRESHGRVHRRGRSGPRARGARLRSLRADP